MADDAITVETDVLIVGSGPSGATMSALLATYGVDNIMLNMWGSTSPTPRAHITNQRAMEILRDLGLEDEAKAVSVPQHLMGDLVLCSSLAGEELGRLKTWHTHPHSKAEHDLASPCAVCDIPQTLMEPLLVQAAQRRGSKVRNWTQYLSLEQDAEGVSARVKDRLTGLEYTIRAKYLVGADGANSQVARDIELPFEGQMGLGGSMNIHFKADLSHLTDHRPADMYWMFQPGEGLDGHGVGVLRMVRPWNDWVGVWGYDISKGEPDLDEKKALEIVHNLIGDDSIDVELGPFNLWTINRMYATETMRGRVFCVGDAIHRHPPMNGLGSNTSMADSYNLAWKLAAAIKTDAGAGLLQTYDEERGPVGEQIVTRAFKSMGLLPPILHALGLDSAPDPASMKKAMAARKGSSRKAAEQRKSLRKAIDGTRYGFNALGIELNQRYESGAMVGDDTEDPGFPRDRDLYYQVSSRPGAHLPHAWLERDERLVSTFDICGKGRFTLLTGLGGSAWVKAAAEAAGEVRLPIDVHIIGPGQTYTDAYGDFGELRGTEEDGALLVRPDMFVGWRAQTSKQAGELTNVMRQLLRLDAPGEARAAAE